MFYLINKTLHSISFDTRLLVYWHALCWLQYGLQSDSLRWWHLTCRRNPVCEKRTNSCILNRYNSPWQHHRKRHHTKITEISEDHVMKFYRVFRSFNLFPLLPACTAFPGSPIRRPVPPSWPPTHAGLKRLQNNGAIADRQHHADRTCYCAHKMMTLHSMSLATMITNNFCACQ